MFLAQALHLKDESAFNLPLIFKHLLQTKWLQLQQKTELLPTLLQQILHGHFTGSNLTDKLFPAEKFCFIAGFGMRHRITHACLCTCLKHQRCVKKSMPCFIKKTSRSVGDITHLKQQCFLSSTFYKIQRSYDKIMYIWLFHWYSGENCIVFTFSLHK